jgi:hypothetical protein
MVDEHVFREELRNLKGLIRNDPAIAARYDLDGDGEISGEEWDRAVAGLREALNNRPVGTGQAAEAVFESVRATTAASDRPSLATCREVVVKQRVERMEVLAGYECSNRYLFYDKQSGVEIGGADESSGGVGGFLSRAFLGPARPLNIDMTDPGQGAWLEARRPFKLLAFVAPPTMAVHSNDGLLGTVTRVWPLVLRRRYRISVANQFDGGLTIDGSLFRPWSFPVEKNGRPVACIQKKWSGAGRELFTDADTFLVRFEDPGLNAAERRLLVAASIAIDFDFFERSPD